MEINNEMDFNKLIKIILDELYELKMYDITITSTVFDKDMYLKKGGILYLEKLNTCSHIRTKKIDENGNVVLKYKINVCINTCDLLGVDNIATSMYRQFRARVEPYIKNLGLTFSNTIDIITTILHELGHVDRIEKFREQGKLYEMKDFDISQKHSISLALGRSNIIRERNIRDINLIYYLSANEQHADNFMYIHFPRIWNRLISETKE